MRIKSLMLRLLAAAAFVASVSVSCSEISFIEINPPADLQSKIDSIAAEKLANMPGDRTELTITTPIVGAEDYSSGWWSAFSDYFKVPQGKCLVLEFINHNGGAVNNWNNWNICVSTTERGADGYVEYFALRSDAYIVNGNADKNSSLIKIDYPDVDGDGDIWNDFRSNMDGASVVMEVDYSKEGVVFFKATHTTADGSLVFTETYEHPVTGTDVTAFLIADGSWMDMKTAYLVPSKIAEIPDEMATSIAVTGVPSVLEIGNEDFWGDGVATVTFADGSTTVADTSDITFVVPDLSTLGTKTILYSYSKTKKGEYGKSVAGTYTLEVQNPIVALEVTTTLEAAYYIGNAKYITMPSGLINVVAEYSDGTKGELLASQYTVNVIEVAEGVDSFTVTHKTASGNVITGTCELNIAQSSLPAQTDPVGLEDCSSGFFTATSQDWKVEPYESQTVSLTLGSSGANAWNGVNVVLRKADLTLGSAGEYGVVRMDNYGWGAGFADIATLTPGWPYTPEELAGTLNGSKVSVTVSNNGDNTASILYYVIDNTGKAYYQYYDGIAVDGTDLQFACVVDGSYFVFD